MVTIHPLVEHSDLTTFTRGPLKCTSIPFRTSRDAHTTSLSSCAKFSWSDPLVSHLQTVGFTDTIQPIMSLSPLFNMWHIHYHCRLLITSSTGKWPMRRLNSIRPAIRCRQVTTTFNSVLRSGFLDVQTDQGLRCCALIQTERVQGPFRLRTMVSLVLTFWFPSTCRQRGERHR